MLEFEQEFTDWFWNKLHPSTKDQFIEMLEDDDLYQQFLEERNGLRDQRTDR